MKSSLNLGSRRPLGQQSVTRSKRGSTLEPGRILAKKYRVLERVHAGIGGEIYRLCERSTGIERTAKLFYPEPQPNCRSSSGAIKPNYSDADNAAEGSLNKADSRRRQTSRDIKISEPVGESRARLPKGELSDDDSFSRTSKDHQASKPSVNWRANRQAQKLHRLRSCDILMQYRTQEVVQYQGEAVTFMISDSIDGELLSDAIEDQPKGYFTILEALHIIHTLCNGLTKVHNSRDFHGAIAADNILIRRQGLGFQVKLIDLDVSEGNVAAGIASDTFAVIKLLYKLLGGSTTYRNLPLPIRQTIGGLKRATIKGKFKNANDVKNHLEDLQW